MTEWMDRASCRGLEDEMFAESPLQQRLAAQRCWDCPVLGECDEWAESVRPSAGIWAGRLWVMDVRTRKVVVRDVQAFCVTTGCARPPESNGMCRKCDSVSYRQRRRERAGAAA